MKRNSAFRILHIEIALYSIMAAVSVPMVLYGLSGCGIFKGASQKQEILAKAESTSVAERSEISTSEINYFGDQIRSTGFIAYADSGKSAVVALESKGIKANIRLTPVYNEKGQQLGQDLEFEAMAKPVAIANSSTSKSEAVKINNKELVAEQTIKEKTRTSFPYSWLLPLIIILLLIAALLFRAWPFKIFFKT